MLCVCVVDVMFSVFYCEAWSCKCSKCYMFVSILWQFSMLRSA